MTLAEEYASRHGKDPRQVEAVLRESRRVVRMDRGLIISETRHGFVCANAGVDTSNVLGEETVCLLPLDPDASAEGIRGALSARLGVELAVVISASVLAIADELAATTELVMGKTAGIPVAVIRGTPRTEDGHRSGPDHGAGKRPVQINFENPRNFVGFSIDSIGVLT